MGSKVLESEPRLQALPTLAILKSFNVHMRGEPLDGEVFYTLKESKIVIGSRRGPYIAIKPNGSGEAQRSAAPVASNLF